MGGFAPGLPVVLAPGDARRPAALDDRAAVGFETDLLLLVVVTEEPEIPLEAGRVEESPETAVPEGAALERGAGRLFVGGKGGGAPGAPGGPALLGGALGLPALLIFFGLMTPAMTWISPRSNSWVFSVLGFDLGTEKFSMSSRVNSAVARRSSSSTTPSVLSARPAASPESIITLRVSSWPHVGGDGSASGELDGAMALV